MTTNELINELEDMEFYVKEFKNCLIIIKDISYGLKDNNIIAEVSTIRTGVLNTFNDTFARKTKRLF